MTARALLSEPEHMRSGPVGLVQMGAERGRLADRGAGMSALERLENQSNAGRVEHTGQTGGGTYFTPPAEHHHTMLQPQTTKIMHWNARHSDIDNEDPDWDPDGDLVCCNPCSRHGYKVSKHLPFPQKADCFQACRNTNMARSCGLMSTAW